MSRKSLIASLLVAAFAVFALADDGDNNQNANFSSTVIGSTPGTIVAGINSGGVSWTVRQGHASISNTGFLNVQVSGLLLASGPSAGTTGPVQNIAASVVCAGGGGTVVASTSAVPLSSLGVAQISAPVTLPSQCAAPVVLLRVSNPGSDPGPFIALNGINTTAAAPDQDDHDK